MEDYGASNQETADSNSGDDVNVNNGPKGRHHFTIEEDLALLRLIVERNPFGIRGQRGMVWDGIEASLHSQSFVCTLKSCQDRLARLLRTYTSDDLRKKSICGQTMDSNAEMAHLLGEIIKLKSEGNFEVKVEPIKQAPKTPRGVIAEVKKSGGSAKYSAPSAYDYERKPQLAESEDGLIHVGKRQYNGLPNFDENAHFAKIPRLALDNGDLSQYQKHKLTLKREELDLLRKDIEVRETIATKQMQLEEAKYKREAEVQEFRLRVESERNELDKQRMALEKDKHEMERRKQDMEIAERTQHLDTMRQQQQVLFQLLSKKLGTDTD